jgi:GNAT superfamily N-acetyltransferase
MKPMRQRNLHIRDTISQDRDWIVETVVDAWSSTRVVSRGVIHDVEGIPGIIAKRGDEKIGLLTYNIIDTNIEIVTLNSLTKREGVGTALINRVEEIARSKGCTRIWVVTTNDNTGALNFYQNLGFQITAIYKNAIDVYRKLKPEIPLVGNNGIPILDEIELEKIIA